MGSKDDIFGTGPQKTRRQVLEAGRHWIEGTDAFHRLPGLETSHCSAAAGVSANVCSSQSHTQPLVHVLL